MPVAPTTQLTKVYLPCTSAVIRSCGTMPHDLASSAGMDVLPVAGVGAAMFDIWRNTESGERYLVIVRAARVPVAAEPLAAHDAPGRCWSAIPPSTTIPELCSISGSDRRSII